MPAIHASIRPRNPIMRSGLGVCLGLTCLLTLPGLPSSWDNCARGADEFERPPISYRQGEPDNLVSRLQQELEQGTTELDYDPRFGYLPALLENLRVPPESQMLVFSRTSLQMRRISPRTPRALYFNDDVYVGYCHQGDVLEVSVADKSLGTVFYTLNQSELRVPRLQRQTDQCLACHASSRTEGVPGHLVRSLFVETSGQPIFAAGGYSVDQTTPFTQRWGGWYVTGTHGSSEHLGNLLMPGRDVPENIDNAPGQNVRDLSDRLFTGNYLTPHSDIVALLVHEHQTFVHNRITKANYATRQALHYEEKLNEALGSPGERLESTTRRIRTAGEELLQALLLVDEAELPDPIEGTSGFAKVFMQTGPRDPQQRSLRDFDLEQRLFRYPCSYLIYSESFLALPEEVQTLVWKRLAEILAGNEDSPTYAHLSTEDRTAIREILQATHPKLPSGWGRPDENSGKE